MNKNPKTILVIEDDALLQEAITIKLKMNNFNPISCLTVNSALDYLSNNQELPSAVWLDFYVKDMDGIDFMEKLKSNPKWASIPVLVISNSAATDNISKMKELGAVDYLLKSEYRLDELINILNKII